VAENRSIAEGHLALDFTNRWAYTWSMSPSAPAAQTALRRLLESEQHARQRSSDAEVQASARVADARRAADDAVRTARDEAAAAADRLEREAIAEAEAAIAAEDARLRAEIAHADLLANENHDAAVARVVRWVTAAEP